jgi:hypothetical protein
LTYIASLNKVSSDQEVLAIRRQLDIVGTNDGLLLIRVIEALGVISVGDIENGNVAANSDGEVGASAVRRNLGVDGG